MYCGKDPAA
jgi:hypothetical protein